MHDDNNIIILLNISVPWPSILTCRKRNFQFGACTKIYAVTVCTMHAVAIFHSNRSRHDQSRRIHLATCIIIASYF